MIGVNNFGFGGTNAVVLGQSAVKAKSISEEVTRFIFGRTEAAVKAYFDSRDLNDAYWQKMRRSSNVVNKFPWRGVVRDAGVISQDGNANVEEKLELEVHTA